MKSSFSSGTAHFSPKSCSSQSIALSANEAARLLYRTEGDSRLDRRFMLAVSHESLGWDAEHKLLVRDGDVYTQSIQDAEPQLPHGRIQALEAPAQQGFARSLKPPDRQLVLLLSQ